MIKAIFFDLDGTLLPFNENEFLKMYFGLLYQKVKHLGFQENKFYHDLMYGTQLMYQNDGTKTNEVVFWEYFDQENQDIHYDKKIFDVFYTNEFKQTAILCKSTNISREIVDFCNQHFPIVVLATNPVFPKVGTKTRMGFASLKEEDFSLVTYYENSSFCKPNPRYFEALLSKYNLKPDEVIMFGNNAYEDGAPCVKLGIKCYLVGDYLLGLDKFDYPFEHLALDEIIPLLKKEVI